MGFPKVKTPSSNSLIELKHAHYFSRSYMESFRTQSTDQDAFLPARREERGRNAEHALENTHDKHWALPRYYGWLLAVLEPENTSLRNGVDWNMSKGAFQGFSVLVVRQNSWSSQRSITFRDADRLM